MHLWGNVEKRRTALSSEVKTVKKRWMSCSHRRGTKMKRRLVLMWAATLDTEITSNISHRGRLEVTKKSYNMGFSNHARTFFTERIFTVWTPDLWPCAGHRWAHRPLHHDHSADWAQQHKAAPLFSPREEIKYSHLVNWYLQCSGLQCQLMYRVTWTMKSSLQ